MTSVRARVMVDEQLSSRPVTKKDVLDECHSDHPLIPCMQDHLQHFSMPNKKKVLWITLSEITKSIDIDYGSAFSIAYDELGLTRWVS